MDPKIEELIAVGASVTANCVPCLQYHGEKAKKAGATLEEVRKAVRIGRMVRKGSAGEWDKDAKAILAE